jgi:hydroxyacylglutathione hydrolase
MSNIPAIEEYEFADIKIRQICNKEYFSQNSYIIIDVKKEYQVVIDPGNFFELLRDKIKENKYPLKKIFLTHGHFDHVESAAALCDYFSVECVIHNADMKLLKRASNYSLLIENREIKIPTMITTYDRNEKKNENDFHVFHTPGHTPGSVCLTREGLIFCGDTLILGGIGKTELPGGNPQQLKETVNKMFTQFHDDMMVFPGHGRSFKIAEAKTWNLL